MAIQDERTGETHDYTRKRGILHTEILAPDDAPDWMRDRAQLWNAVEKIEKRKDSQLARELQLNLPHELSFEQSRELVRTFILKELVRHGMIADLAIHAPNHRGDERNSHAHVMLTMRELMGDGFGKKARQWNGDGFLEQWREAWAHYQNQAFERLGLDVRVDHRSYDRQGIDREPTEHLGPIAAGMERSGKRTEKGDRNREIAERNAERERLTAEYIDLQEERERRWNESLETAALDAYDRDQEHQAQRSRFEERVNARAAELKLKQLDARRGLEASHSAEMAQHRTRMFELYGRDRQELAQRAAEIDANAQLGGVRSLLHRLTGRRARELEERERIGLTLTDLDQREGEATGMIEHRHRTALNALDQRHSREHDGFTERMNGFRIERGFAPEPDRQGGKDMQQRGPDGQEMFVDHIAPEPRPSGPDLGDLTKAASQRAAAEREPTDMTPQVDRDPEAVLRVRRLLSGGLDAPAPELERGR